MSDTDPAATDPARIDIEHELHIAASIETVWKHWVDPERMASWWGAAELSPVEDGRFRVVMEGGEVMSGSYISLEPPHRLVFSFGWEGNAVGDPLAPGSTTVEVSLVENGNDTVLTLRHRDLPDSYRAGHDEGWTRFLAALANRCAD